MSRATDTTERVLKNLDGETKPESLSAEEAFEVYEAVADGAMIRADALRSHVESLKSVREPAVAAPAPEPEPEPVLEPEPLPEPAPEPESVPVLAEDFGE